MEDRFRTLQAPFFFFFFAEIEGMPTIRLQFLETMYVAKYPRIT